MASQVSHQSHAFGRFQHHYSTNNSIGINDRQINAYRLASNSSRASLRISRLSKTCPTKPASFDNKCQLLDQLRDDKEFQNSPDPWLSNDQWLAKLKFIHTTYHFADRLKPMLSFPDFFSNEIHETTTASAPPANFP